MRIAEELHRGPDVETETVAGVAVPTTCSDRVDPERLATAVSVLEEYNVSNYTVSPVGGVQIWLGIHRPEEVKASVHSSLDRTGGGVTDHGTTDGFHRLRVDVTVSGADAADAGDDTSRRE